MGLDSLLVPLDALGPPCLDGSFFRLFGRAGLPDGIRRHGVGRRGRRRRGRWAGLRKCAHAARCEDAVGVHPRVMLVEEGRTVGSRRFQSRVDTTWVVVQVGRDVVDL